MQPLTDALNPFEELSIYLVATGKKPAATVSLSPFRTSGEPEDVFAKIIVESGLLYKQVEAGSFTFHVGSSEENLEALVKATSDEERGLAYGYPNEAVRTYRKVIRGQERDGAYVMREIEKAVDAGIEIPVWLAYVWQYFVPEEMDIVSNNFSPYYISRGQTCQTFVRQNNPNLAARVESAFKHAIAIQVGLDKQVKFKE